MKIFQKFLVVVACGVLIAGLASGCGGEEAVEDAGGAGQVVDAALAAELEPLIYSLCFSEALHYDAFDAEPDEVTTTYTLWHLVAYTEFRHRDQVPEFEGAYYFSDGPESEEMADDREIYYGPDALYGDYFTNGQFKYAPEEISFLIEGTQTGIAVHLSDAPYAIDTQINEMTVDGDEITVSVTLSRGFYDEEPPELIGDAQIVLTKNEAALYGYSVTSFTPDYDAFETIYLQ